ncbi:hypothetical protein T439DRAFT_330080 [Meredithblackwellia eburnea MCA 4105]
MSDNEQPQETKPEGNQHISLKIAGSGFPDLLIKVKRTTKLSKMMNAYCERAGKSLNEVRFMFDGNKIKPTDTIADLEIEEDEDEITIDVTSEAVGGRS